MAPIGHNGIPFSTINSSHHSGPESEFGDLTFGELLGQTERKPGPEKKLEHHLGLHFHLATEKRETEEMGKLKIGQIQFLRKGLWTAVKSSLWRHISHVFHAHLKSGLDMKYKLT
ncbi:uncharacterized protein LOC118146826 isoform X1 [Callithrix jacchus]|uniref:uncharacterized protein LOC118146826 isoform X3 n=1 Tax=Callithrix jacchus TaxID=9483 RepID=UPI0023DD010A|nr:uncharacterized protein LOC118146826 isoform X3 [Callithrix jacchus]XP_054096569.1 uncharacterized protein LOC118146826 isoform X3 [Callithrix jacchus]